MSDILIKGMEMPESCGYCFLRHEARDGDECCFGASLTEYQKRPKDCPLVPVPPHGRCVDADELAALVRANISLLDSVPGRMGADQKLVRAWLASMVDDIEEAPTIIPAEDSRLSATIKCGGAVTCTVASEEVYRGK